MGVHPRITAAQARASARAGTTVPEYTATVKVGTKNFTYTIVGKNPAIKVTNPATTVNAEIVPVIMKFRTADTWNPTKADSCDPGASALARTQKSPVVVSQSWKFGGTSIGTGQYIDAFQRAEFWKYAKPTGINPTFGDTLSVKTLPAVTINVPIAEAAELGPIGCGNGLLGAADINWLDPHLQNVVIPSLASQGVGTTTFPIFLLHNFVEFVDTTGHCCVLGYHNILQHLGRRADLRPGDVRQLRRLHRLVGHLRALPRGRRMAERPQRPSTRPRRGATSARSLAARPTSRWATRCPARRSPTR